MKNVVLKNITDKADELARLYNKTKDPKYKEKWYKLLKQIKQVKKMRSNYLQFPVITGLSPKTIKGRVKKKQKIKKGLKDPKFRAKAKIMDYKYVL